MPVSLFYAAPMFSLEEIIDIAVHLEKNGESFYRKAAEIHSDPSLISRLQWLADEEASHAEKFSAMKQSVKIEVADPSLAEMGRRLFQQAMGQQSFSLTDEGLSEIQNIQELIKLAVEFEKDTIIFYEMLRSFIEDETVLEQLDQIIAEEHRHVDELQALLADEAH